MPKKADLTTGTKFGHLTVVSKSTKTYRNGAQFYSCACDCGGFKEVRRSDLVSGKQETCGCFLRKTKSILPNGEASHRELYYHVQRSAKARKIECYLTLEEHKIIIAQNCHYCGAPPKPWNKYQRLDGSSKSPKIKSLHAVNSNWILASGVDRVDSKIGYVSFNCVPCCAVCNIAKNVLSAQEFIEHCKQVARFQESKNAA